MSTVPIIKTTAPRRTLAERLLRGAYRHYLQQRIRWAQQDMANLEHERDAMPARMQVLSAWIEARRVEVALLERAP